MLLGTVEPVPRAIALGIHPLVKESWTFCAKLKRPSEFFCSDGLLLFVKKGRSQGYRLRRVRPARCFFLRLRRFKGITVGPF
ncbi:MAG: hypothetical protein ACOYJZ_05800 [Acutalibacter sp.]